MPLIYNLNKCVIPIENNIKFKIASFDYDHTLVTPQQGRRFPKNVDDWQWFNNNVPIQLQKLFKDGFLILIFTNQSKEWKCTQIHNVLSTLNIPLIICIAMKKDEYKPSLCMFNSILTSKQQTNIDFNNSFFIGDAIGRKTDFSDSDLLFGKAIGFNVLPPESFFKSIHREDNIKVTIPIIDIPEVIIMVGMPGSGKTTIANNILGDERGYVIISGDTYKTSKKMIKKASEFKNCSIVFDATNNTIKKRNEYITFAREAGFKYIRCIHLTTSFDESWKRNQTRSLDKQIPKVAYAVYNKYFESPSIIEGFNDIILL